jgi:hypothetical protein
MPSYKILKGFLSAKGGKAYNLLIPPRAKFSHKNNTA